MTPRCSGTRCHTQAMLCWASSFCDMGLLVQRGWHEGMGVQCEFRAWTQEVLDELMVQGPSSDGTHILVGRGNFNK